MGPQWRWARAFAAWAVVVGAAGCDDYSRGPTAATATQHVLRVQASGAGSGTVTSPDASPQISCDHGRGPVRNVRDRVPEQLDGAVDRYA